ncbi:SRPBCC domain-containing protein [Cohnella faecalis]|uniref:SRPBCC domain-containing protein n=1 Tax=Cohnella faecalis TaxID=2315694 RepID=A0A398D0L1_9BACL|nr:SRPBCC domain-containing protein [Cohnella faecalis]RIE04694.1 SRPBCC domain-containing protein [Cohnella faecalis]
MEKRSTSESIVLRKGERDFVVERTFDAPKALVFKAFTRPEHVARWWAPGGYTIPVCKIDLRPGGLWHYCMRSPEGQDQWVRAVYREIVEPDRIVYVITFADEEGNPTEEIPEQEGTITFDDYAGKTKVSIRIMLGTAEELKWTLEMGMVEGMTETLGNLAKLLNEIES